VYQNFTCLSVSVKNRIVVVVVSVLIVMPPTSTGKGYYEMRAGVCLSVCCMPLAAAIVCIHICAAAGNSHDIR